MARSNTANTANRLTVGSTPVTAAPLTIACWFKPNNLTTNSNLIFITTTANGSEYIGLGYDGANANALGDNVVLAFSASAGNGEKISVSPTGGTAGTWMHCAGVFASSASRTAYLNGASGSAETTSVVPSSLNYLSVGAWNNGSPSVFSPIDGAIADVAIWNVALTDAEIASLSKGLSPLLVRPANLVFYTPLLGRHSPEPEIVGARHLTMTGTMPVAAHAPIFNPVSPITTAPQGVLDTGGYIFQEDGVSRLINEDDSGFLVQEATVPTNDRSLALAKGTYTYTVRDATFVQGRNIGLAAGSYTRTDRDATLLRKTTLALAKGDQTYTPKAATLARGYRTLLAAGTYTRTDKAAMFAQGRKVALAKGDQTYTTKDSAFFQSRKVALAKGDQTYTPKVAGFFQGRKIALAAAGTGGDVLASVLLNYDASNAASITGTSPITAVDDQSSYGNDGTTQFPQASYNAATKAFRNGVVNINHAAIGTEWNAFFVATKLNGADDFRSILYHGPGEVYILTSTGSDSLGSYHAGFAPAGSLTWPINERHIVRCQNLSSGVSLSLDGGSLNATGQVVGDGNPNFFGAWLAGSQYWGDIHQVVFLPQNASVADIEIVEGALAWKWDAELGSSTLVTALPSGHTYKNAAPVSGGYPLVFKDSAFIRGRPLALEKGTYTRTDRDATFAKGSAQSITLDKGTYTYTVRDATFARGYRTLLATGTYARIDRDATLLRKTTLTLATGSYARTDKAATFAYGYRTLLATGTYTRTDKSASFFTAHKVTLAAGTYTRTDRDANFLKGGAQTLALAKGDQTYTPKDAGFFQGRKVALEKGNYSYRASGGDVTSGQVARYTFNAGNANADVGSVNGVNEGTPIFSNSELITSASNVVRIESNFGRVNASRSFSVWFKHTGDEGTIIGQTDSNTFGGETSYVPVINTFANGNVSGIFYPGGPELYVISSGTNYGDSNWHHAVWQWDSTSQVAELFVDGVSKGTTGTFTPSEGWWTRTYLGYCLQANASPARPGNAFFAGSIDDFCVYDRALTLVEVQQLYSGGANFIRGRPFALDKGTYSYTVKDSAFYKGGAQSITLEAGAYTRTDKAATFTKSAPTQSMSPSSDVSLGSWTNELDGTPLYASIDEAIPNLTDYIHSSVDPVNDSCVVELSNPTSPIAQPFMVSYYYGKETNNSDVVNLTARLLEGSTEIAAWVHTDIPYSAVQVDQVLTAPQYAAITDPTAVRLEFIANPATTIITDENGATMLDENGLAILDS